MLVHDCSGLPFEVLPCIYGAKKKNKTKLKMAFQQELVITEVTF